jgi:hypothetical protein
MINDSKADFESLTIQFKNEDIFLYYEELISYYRLLADGQWESLLRTARELASKTKGA